MNFPWKQSGQKALDASVERKVITLGIESISPLLSLVPASLLLLSCTSYVAIWKVGLWFSLIVLNCMFGLAVRRSLRKLPTPSMTHGQVRQVRWNSMAYVATTSLLWGGSGLLMVKGQAEHNLMITMIYLSVCSGAASISIFGLAHLLIGSLLAFLLFASAFQPIFPGHWLVLLGMFAFYHVVIVRTAWERNAMLINNLILQEEKDVLVFQHREAAQLAEQANHDKSVFLAAASHDLRQPVHALMLTSHALRMRLGDDANRLLVDRILEAGHILAEQFNNLMDLSRLESGVYQTAKVEVDLQCLLQKAIATHGQVAVSKAVSLRLRIDRRLRQQRIYCDGVLLGRILDNLIDNAIKFTGKGGQILVAARQFSGRLRLAVHDQGIGIVPGEIRNIFKPYVQLNNPARDRTRGIGLGLTIVSEAATRLEANLHVSSVPGRGSSFFLDIPLTLATTSEVAQITLEPEMLHGRQLQGRHLLIVDDDPLAADALKTWAEGWGLRVSQYAMPEAVSSTLSPELILCDIRLPSPRDGIDWLSEWLAQWPDTRGLLISGELLPETHRRAEQEGLILLSKPVDPDLLLRTLSGMVSA